MTPKTENRALRILSKLEEMPGTDQRTQNYLAALRKELEDEEQRQEDTSKQLAAYEEAYQKLTAPANRVGVFLRELADGKVVVALGETEYVALVDPNLEHAALEAGVSVMLNEAFAVVGVLDASGNGPLVKVGETLEDGRLRIGGDPNQQGRLVARSARLAEAAIRPGDEVRLEASGKFAVEHFAHQDTRDYFVEEVSEVPWERIGGQKEAIGLIRETIEHPLLYPELYERFDKRPVKGILLYGPPGCGKTLIGKAIAYNLAREYSERVGHTVKEYFMHISGPKILNMWLGETERMVREIFAIARERAKEGRLVVIFMDEAESILRTRSGGRYLNISNTVVPQFCAELDGLVSLENVVLILTSNRPDYIDPAILRPERIDRKVKIQRPDHDSAREILSLYLHDRLPMDPDLVAQHDGEPSCARRALLESTLAFLWRSTTETAFLDVFLRSGAKERLHWKDMVSGALLKSIVDRAKDSAIRRAIADPTHGHGLNEEDLRLAVVAEYRENEIFPKNDAVEDWLKLLDIEPESVATVKPIRASKGEEFLKKTVV